MTLDPALNRLFERGRSYLGCEYPIMCGAMTWVSEPGLVAAVCNAGAFACLAGGNTPPDILRAQIEQVRSLTDQPFGINLITIAPAYREHLALLPEFRIPHVVFAGSFPRKSEVAIAKDSGAKVMCFASTMSIADRMLRFGTDALILEGSEAGGHIGHVSALVLMQQVLFEASDRVPVFIAGGIATGRMIAHIMTMGAAGVQLGTRFVMTDECIAHPDFKKAFARANARDAMATPEYDSKLPVVAVRALRNKGMAGFGELQLKLLKALNNGSMSREEAQIKVENYWMGALRRAVIDGDVETGSMMAGQSVGLVRDVVPVRDLIRKLVSDASDELKRIHSLLHD